MLSFMTTRSWSRLISPLTLIEGVLFYPAPNLAGQVFGYDALLLQRPESFENDPHREDRAEDNWRHQPAAGFNDFNHVA
jgi:hypothetical protein